MASTDAAAAAAAAAEEKRKGKRPMSPEEEAAAAEAKPSSAPSDPEEGKGEGEKVPAAAGDDDDSLVLVTECGTELRISRSAAAMSAMLAGMMDGDCAEGRIRVPGVHAGILRMVVAYCEKHAPHYDPAAAALYREPFPPFPIDLTPATHAIRPVTQPEPDPHGLEAWDKVFINTGVDNSTLFAIILAANFMGIEDLLDLGCTAVADKMRGKKPEEIREEFEIENDYTPEQEAAVRQENAWAFED